MQSWEIKDPVHGYIELYKPEIDVVDSPQFQRLRRLRQLSAAFLTYPGAEHTRFHHSLGVLHIAGKIAQRLQNSGLITEEEMLKLRLGGLLHDIGHGPFSHLFEEVLQKRDLNHEQMTTRIIKETTIADILREHGLDPEEMSTLSIGQHENKKPYLNQIIAGQFSADVLDYLPRDSYFTGVEYGKVDIDRLVRSMDVVDGRLAVKDTALYVLEAMVIARYEMFKAVYFHRSVRAAETMLVRAMQLGDEELGITSFRTADEYHKLDDSSIIHMLMTLKDSKDKHSKTAYQLTQGFQNRRLLKCAYETLVHRRDRFTVNMMLTGNVRTNIEQEIAEEAKIDPSTVIIDVSSAPSVPYYARQQKPQDIPLYNETPDGEKHLVSFSSQSPLGDTLVGYLDIMRVYTPQKDRDAVRKAAESKFGKTSVSTQISY
jgi:HD superfamily phosphohydrolase